MLSWSKLRTTALTTALRSTRQAQEAARIAGLLEHQAAKGAQLKEAKKARAHANRKKFLERSVDLADKRDKVHALKAMAAQSMK